MDLLAADTVAAAVAAMTPDELRQVIALERAIDERTRYRRLWTYYPDDGPLRRALYPKHLKFFADGLEHRERLFLAANRVGKTEGAGGYESALHLTGLYPPWWVGRRFHKPVTGWVAGKTNETTRDIVQAKLFGDVQFIGPRKRLRGTGLVPLSCIGELAWKRGSDLLDRAHVRHHGPDGKHDGWSKVGLKSYEQGRGAFEGTEQHFVWLDEEPPMPIYTECLVRTMTTGGIVMLTFTPLEGMSEVVLAFLPGGELPGGGGGRGSEPYD
jgi:phage terminase large subunit-like protein